MIISRTPLRMSFAGGATDFKDYYRRNYGAVVSSAINKYVYVSISRKFDDLVRVSYSKTEEVSDINKLEHNLIREALRLTGVTKGVDINYASDMLPAREGTGLGASSSLAVGVLNALHTFKGERADSVQLAKEACQIEIELLKHPIGKQDQYAAAFGNLNYIKFLPGEDVLVEPIACKPEFKKELKKNLMLLYTCLSSQSKDVLPEQNKKIELNVKVLDKMVGLAENLKSCLRNNDLKEFGNILHENWLLKRSLASKISNSEIDNYYEKAREAGAVGGKILGSGGGGFLLLYVEPDKQEKVRQALSNLKETVFDFEPEGSRIVYSD
ncbi:MAG: GHMP kinase [bacterium]|nr:GHMP kinase [bacterium]